MALILLGCEGPAAPPAVDGGADAGAPRILSAFFGLDNALPMTVELICRGAGGRDGMPVTFSRRVTAVPAAAAFRVVTRSGASRTPACATLAPALNASERHTVLLGGDLGDEPGDPPVRLEIVGSLALEGGADARGLSADVVPLAAGPSLVLALRYDRGGIAGSACPAATERIVQVAWNGGVTSLGGGPVGEVERRRIHVMIERDGARVESIPDALADLNDNDNYLHLCLSAPGRPVSVRVEAGTFVDPRNDPNAETTIDVDDGP